MQHERPVQILIAPDSFKDCLGALEVAGALGRGIQRFLPDAGIVMVPMADGGEGTVESIIHATGGKLVRVGVSDPLGRPVDSFFGISGDGQIAVIEMAAASGIELLEPGERNPWITSTAGTGQLIRHALDRGCASFLLGIGGSATNDGGTGMASALGIRFLDERGKPVNPGGGALGALRRIDMSGLDPRIGQAKIRVACDVTNPLTGPEGASVVYGPQKGADPEMVKALDHNLARLARLIDEQLGIKIDRIPGAGAAGGLGAGLMAFLGAELVKGFDMVATTVGLEEEVARADLVITGEGRMDRQTRFGKTPHGVALMARKRGKPVIGVAGTLDEGYEELYDHGFRAIFPILEKPSDLAYAIEHARELLERTGERIARMISLSR